MEIVIGISVAVSIAVVMPFLVSRQRKQLSRIEPLLKDRGALTLDEVAKELGTSMFAKGYLMQALDQLAAEGKLTKTAPPKGHPMLRIARDTRYGLTA